MITKTDEVYYSDLDITIITMNNIINTVVLETYNTIYNLSISNKDKEMVIQHNLIKELSKRVSKTRGAKLVLLQSTMLDPNLDVWNHEDPKSYLTSIETTLKSLQRVLPYPLLLDSKNIDLYKASGELEELKAIIKAEVEFFKTKNYSLNNMKKYANNNGLIFIRDQLFNTSNLQKCLC